MNGQGATEIKARPIAAALFVWWAVHGVLTVAGAAVPGFDPSLVVSALPEALAVAIGLSIMVGGVAALYGMAAPIQTDTAWTIEATGLIVGGAAWLAYGIAGAVAWPLALEHTGSSLTYAICAAVRLRQLYRLYRLNLAVSHLAGAR